MNNRGFTLIEMIVALGIFSVAIVIAVSTFLNLQDAERKIQGKLTVVDNLRFALEIMAKEARTGTAYGSSGSSFSFTNVNGLAVVYRLNAGQIEKSLAGASFQPLTAGDITVEDLDFYVRGAPSGDNIQPWVLISIKAFAETKGAKESFSLQTSVSQRKPAP